MRCTVICLLVVLCTVNTTVLNPLLEKVKLEKSTVIKCKDRVNNLRYNTVQNTDATIMKKWLKEIEKLKNYIERTLKAMDKDVNKAKDENAQYCYDAALNFIRNTDYASYTHALVCHEYAKSFIKSNLEFIDNLVWAGRKLWLDLDNIFPRCWRDNASGISNILKLRDCINNRLKKCKDDVSCLKRDADSAEHTAKTAFNNVIKESDKCLNDAYSASQSNITLAKEVFDRCLATSCKKTLVV